MPDPARWLAEADVASLVSLPEAIDLVEEAFVRSADGCVTPLEKTHASWGDGHTLHAIGAVDEGTRTVGTKTWAHTAGGATPLMVVWDLDSGRLVGVAEAFALGQLRTSAVTGVATRAMADDDASTLAIVGSGSQALAQVAAVCAVRPIRTVRVYSRTPDRRSRFAAELARTGLVSEATATDSIEEATDGADIVITVTRSTEPFLFSRHVGAGTHVNAVGAITPERQEVAPDVLARCSLVASDSVAAARRLASELRDVPVITPLADVLTGRDVRTNGDVTVFKAMGSGMADLAIAEAAFRRAADGGIGRQFDQPARTTARLKGDSA